MKLLWTGSDALFLIKFPPGIRLRFRMKIIAERILLKLMRTFIQEHYVDHKLLKYHLIQIGIKNVRVMPDMLTYKEKIPKIKHIGFNILYYHPKGKNNPKFIKWLYGIDIIEKLKKEITGVNWIRVDGTADMRKIFPITDFYLRPTRHDGASRLRQECEIQEIPYYWSQQNPDIDKIREEINKCRH